MSKIKREMVKSFNILSIGSSGCVGWEELLNLYPDLLRCADLLAGSSVGGVQALCLAAGKNPLPLPEKDVQFFLEELFGKVHLGDLDKRIAVFTDQGTYQNFGDASAYHMPLVQISTELLMPATKELIANPALLALAQVLNTSSLGRGITEIRLLSMGNALPEGPDWVHFLCRNLLQLRYKRMAVRDLDSTLDWLKGNWV